MKFSAGLAKELVHLFCFLLVVLLVCGAIGFVSWHNRTTFSTPLLLNDGRDGVFVFCGGYQTEVVELKSGKFRYWIRGCVSSDGLGYTNDGEILTVVKYPVSGNYTVKTGRVSFRYPLLSIESRSSPQTNTNYFRTNEWFCVRHQGKVALWTVEGWESWNPSNRLGGKLAALEATDWTFESAVKNPRGAIPKHSTP